MPLNANGKPTGVWRAAYSSSFGQFTIDTLSPGRYLVRVRRVGYLIAADTITFENGGIALVVPMIRDELTFDECGLTRSLVRVPWWRR